MPSSARLQADDSSLSEAMEQISGLCLEIVTSIAVQHVEI
jgi:hypothetical protein